MITCVAESHKYIYPETPFLMETRNLQPPDFATRILALKVSFLWNNIPCIVVNLKAVKVGEDWAFAHLRQSASGSFRLTIVFPSWHFNYESDVSSAAATFP